MRQGLSSRILHILAQSKTSNHETDDHADDPSAEFCGKCWYEHTREAVLILPIVEDAEQADNHDDSERSEAQLAALATNGEGNHEERDSWEPLDKSHCVLLFVICRQNTAQSPFTVYELENFVNSYSFVGKPFL